MIFRRERREMALHHSSVSLEVKYNDKNQFAKKMKIHYKRQMSGEPLVYP